MTVHNDPLSEFARKYSHLIVLAVIVLVGWFKRSGLKRWLDETFR